MKRKEDLIKAIENLEYEFESEFIILKNAYKQALNDVVDLVNKSPIHIVNDSCFCQCESINYSYGEPVCNICGKVVNI